MSVQVANELQRRLGLEARVVRGAGLRGGVLCCCACAFALLACERAEQPVVEKAKEVAAAPTPAAATPDAAPTDEPEPGSLAQIDNEPRVRPIDNYDGPVAPPLPPPAERVPEGEVAKAERVIRQVTSYVMAIASASAAPASLEELKPLLLAQYNIEWPNDPWKTPYVYEPKEGKAFEIYSCGPDQKPGTEDDIRVSAQR